MTEVLKHIESIKTIFLDTQLFFAEHDDINEVIRYLENLEPEFRSIAYEAVSMSLALKDLHNEQPLTNWLLYVNGPALNHKAQVYIGLGWAIAKLNLPFLPVVEKIETIFYHRIADGCGYYDGSFRQRQSVINQQSPAYLPQVAMPIYDQGIGRSLWYTGNADLNRIRTKIESFTPQRHADLWRGVGIAVAYVGGCDNETLKTLLEYALTDAIQLACGSALAARSRMRANTMTEDTDRCTRLWYSLTAGESNVFSLENNSMNDEQAYLNWIINIEEGLAASFERMIVEH